MKLTVVDEHHEVFLLWEEALSSGKIHKGTTLLHVDAHSDSGIPFISESVYSKDVTGFVQRQLNIGNFIIPAVMRGVFKEVVFLDRGFKAKKANKKRKQYIGSLYGKGIWINNDFTLNKLSRRLYPDAKQWYYYVTDEPEAVRIKEAVLDIDLDYFYGYYYPQPEVGLRLTKAQIKKLKRLSLSDDRYKFPLRFFNIKEGILKAEYYPRLKEMVYNDSKPWIECDIRYFVESLKMKPSLISICRSVKSGYTPQKYAKFTEETLINYLTGQQKNKIDPCDIISSFKIYPFATCIGNTIYNPLTDDIIELKKDSRFIWERIRRGENFPQIFKAMQKTYDIQPQHLKREIAKFIFRLKRGFIIK